MLISSIDPDLLSRDQMTRLVFGDQTTPGDDPGDCIFVFGATSSAKDRVRVAVDLFERGKADKLLFSGGTRWGRWSPEALMMRDLAVEAGVPEEAILLESDSNHTVENVLASLLVLNRAIGLNRIKRLLVVSTSSHMRRCLLTLKTYMPPWISYSWHPSHREWAETWWKREDIRPRVEREVRSLIRYVQEGYILDEDVPL